MRIEYILTRKNIKNLNMRIDENGLLKISAPYNLSFDFIEKFVLKNEKSILKIRENLRNKKICSLENKKMESGEKIYFWGKETEIKFSLSFEDSFFENGIIFIHRDERAAFEDKKEALRAFLQRSIEDHMNFISEKIYRDYFSDKIDMPQIKYKTLKSRWGSCCRNKNLITYNNNLVFLPKEFAFYVAVHEFCHFLVFDHSKKFYNEVEKILPDYKKLRNIGKDYAI